MQVSFFGKVARDIAPCWRGICITLLESEHCGFRLTEGDYLNHVVGVDEDFMEPEGKKKV